MRAADYIRLFSLAAIWGGSFIFMRVLAPTLGAFATADFRVLFAGLVLTGYAAVIGLKAGWSANWRHYLIIGLLYSGIPATLFCFAALHLPAGYSAIINSLTPVFGALFAALWLNERITSAKVLGLLLGIGGVGLVAWRGGASHDPMVGWAVLACVGATVCYGLGGAYTKKFGGQLRPLAIATYSQLSAGLVMLPVILVQPPRGPVTASLIGNLAGLVILCSAVAYVVFYRLIADVGPTRAMTVTFLIPVFGIVWGALFLGEHVTPSMLLGFALVISGTLIVGGTLKGLLRPARAAA